MGNMVRVTIMMPDGSEHVVNQPVRLPGSDVLDEDHFADLVDLLRDSPCARAQMVARAIDMRAGNPATLIANLIAELTAGVEQAQRQNDDLRAELAEWRPIAVMETGSLEITTEA